MNTQSPAFKILLVDDEPAWLRSMALTLESSAGYTNILACLSGEEALGILERGEVGLALLDLTMPGLSGEELLALVGERHPEVACIIVSGLNQLQSAVRCMKLGAWDYFVKTDDEDRIVGGVRRAVRMLELREENRLALSRLTAGGPATPEAFAGIITRSRAMLSIFAYVEAVAPSPQPLLVTGESGVGKENLVRAAHALSGRSGPLVCVNVAGLDDAMFADTLFGHVRGAFTGADGPRKGMVGEASGGTLFLDEVGDLSVPSQVKLLRLLQEGEYFPLGSDQPRRSNARVIVATHRDLAAREAAGEFRRDLYFRLRTHHVHVPALRERKEDIEPLLRHFLAEAARELGKPVPTPPRELAGRLACYPFPGNVRELRAMVYDAVSVHPGRTLSMAAFEKAICQEHGHPAPPGEPNPFASFERLPSFSEAARHLVQEAMARAGGNQTLAARLLGISQPALSKRLKAMRESGPQG
ncbi:Transcriptional regulatory protein ZraR [Fundidesulfovibrio magnetotacticus]|uniref:Transcriptional regulatory protein ZraR n=1 Tax=Fundidesulfovibrio magnetotacticus TaxID=2730080 RepID=A0A6V8LNX2_9BACT|nr:sigma-54 dependent transcriptional regulator [Fundidesulfovibrio magnetotacticus]GFK93404.1 Transcriptional regulatory protein ZraR [Fundidesulfovibrio magnetotacticus]